MIPRYTCPEMAAIWDPQTRFRIWFEIEAHATDALADLGVVPKAAAFQSLSQQLGGSISTAALVTLLARREAFHQDILAANVTHAFLPFTNFIAQHGSLGQLYATVLNEASALSYADAQFAIGILALVLIPVVFIMPKKKTGAPPVTPVFE